MIRQNVPDKIGERNGFGQPDFFTTRQSGASQFLGAQATSSKFQSGLLVGGPKN
jgi:hypothetical protein